MMGGVGWDVKVLVHVTLMMLRWSWGGVGWDVNVHVHVTLMMLRWSWGGVGWDINVHVHVSLILTFMLMLWWLSDPLLETGAKCLAMDVAQNKVARQKFRETHCHEQTVPWLKMVEVVFEQWRNRRARLHAHLHWEVHATPLKPNRRLSAPFPTSYIILLPYFNTVGIVARVLNIEPSINGISPIESSSLPIELSYRWSSRTWGLSP